MFSLRLFPSFEKPVARQKYLNVSPLRRSYGGIVAVLALSALWGLLLTVPDALQLPKTPAVEKPQTVAAKPEQTVAAAPTAAEDESVIRLSALCTDKPTARRACAAVKAAREARLAEAHARAEAKAATSSSPPAVRARKTSTAASGASAQATAETEQSVSGPRQKTKTARVADETPVARLVHVYDHIAPDGQRVPVYRRGNGAYEFGAVVDGEYRQSRRAELGQPRVPNIFGLQ